MFLLKFCAPTLPARAQSLVSWLLLKLFFFEARASMENTWSFRRKGRPLCLPSKSFVSSWNHSLFSLLGGVQRRKLLRPFTSGVLPRLQVLQLFFKNLQNQSILKKDSRYKNKRGKRDASWFHVWRTRSRKSADDRWRVAEGRRRLECGS